MKTKPPKPVALSAGFIAAEVENFRIDIRGAREELYRIRKTIDFLLLFSIAILYAIAVVAFILSKRRI